MRTKRNTRVSSVKEAAKVIESQMRNDGKPKVFLPSGCLMIDLACAGTSKGFIEPGMIFNLVGDSNAGKTFLAMTILAACFYKYGDAYNYVYLDYERAVSFNIAELFGSAFAKALQYIPIPAGVEATIEKWYKRINKTCTINEKPTISVTDSFDNLTCLAELKFIREQEKVKDGEKEKGTFGTEKAKIASQRLGKACQLIADNGSILIIISQVRDKIGGFARFSFDNKTRNGGKALRFYSGLEAWLSVGERIGTNKKRPIGSWARMVVKRSRITGKYRSCEFPILYAYGVDDTRASINFLVEEGYWSENGNTYNMKDFSFKGKMKACVEYVEDQNHPERVKKLRKLVISAWNEIEEKVKQEAVGNRKAKFPQ